ncbi:DUF1836 domain-containing protein [Clostridium tarantellae]|uniref:DUF1836 domain-containing protein n=1 Tax=Clostridium tarantellae TaxID=39493 RepID=A0A6I1MJV7_9CLOT|nr:DUF1836 domain-containing protein [Clostridium tarantellae]MPQ43224.1 DUF1836 domain-containing protein [Clostridium tarantellae]
MKLQVLLDELCLKDNILLNDIPEIDLYMDQVIQLFENKLGKVKRYEEDKILTKTMINNYSKGKLLMTIKNKKYSKAHIIIMCFIYNLKGILSLTDIKIILEPIVKAYDEEKINVNDIESLYFKYLELYNEDLINIKNIINDEKTFKINSEDTYKKNSEKLLLVLSLVNNANIYRRLAEKVIDTKE